MSMETFFDLQTPGDLLRKLERKYKRWEAAPLNSDYAWNFFVTAEHLPDWIYHQDMYTSGEPRPDLLDGKKPYDFKMDQAHPELRICSHLANGGKHFYLRDTNLTSVTGTRRREGWAEPGWVEPGWVEGEALMVDLAPDKTQPPSSPAASVEALALAATVLEFWRHFPALQSPTEPPTP